MPPKDKTGWPIIVGAIVRVHPPDLKAYTGEVIGIATDIIRVKHSSRDYKRYAKSEHCTVQRRKVKK